jgi:hypothetical protein
MDVFFAKGTKGRRIGDDKLLPRLPSLALVFRASFPGQLVTPFHPGIAKTSTAKPYPNNNHRLIREIQPE